MSTSPQPLADPLADRLAARHFWLAVVALFAVLHTPAEVTLGWLTQAIDCVWPAFSGLDKSDLARDLNTLCIVEVRRLAFYGGLLVVGYALVRQVWPAWRAWPTAVRQRLWLVAGGVFVTLGALVLPLVHSNVEGGLGVAYCEMSARPFTEPVGVIFRRLLKPALAHLLQLDSPLTYLLFGLAITLGVLLLSATAFARHSVPTVAPVPSVPTPIHPLAGLWLLSLASGTYVTFDYAYPGSTDQLVFVMVLLVFAWPLSPQARLAALALGLCAHEAAVFIFAPLVWYCFPRAEWRKAVLVVAIYGGLFLVGHSFHLQSFRAIHGWEGVPWHNLLKDPHGWLIAVFMGNKLLWAVPMMVMFIPQPGWSWKTRLAPLLLTVIPLALPVISLDTARLAGYSFSGVLLGLARLWQAGEERPLWRRLGTGLCVLNVLLPTYIWYQGAVDRPGLYLVWRRLWQLLAPCVFGG